MTVAVAAADVYVADIDDVVALAVDVMVAAALMNVDVVAVVLGCVDDGYVVVLK